MVQRVATVAFEGIEARAVDVQVQVAPGVHPLPLVFRGRRKSLTKNLSLTNPPRHVARAGSQTYVLERKLRCL
ncbi:MAG: hypothetical protein WBD96_02035 [Pseudolabrys sp.]